MNSLAGAFGVLGILLIFMGLHQIYKKNNRSSYSGEFQGFKFKNLPLGLILLLAGLSLTWAAERIITTTTKNQSPVNIYIQQSNGVTAHIPEIVIPAAKNNAADSLSETALLKNEIKKTLNKPQYAKALKLNKEPAVLNTDDIRMKTDKAGNYYLTATAVSSMHTHEVVFDAVQRKNHIVLTPDFSDLEDSLNNSQK